MTAARNKIDCDLDATDGRVPDAPARPKTENAVINKREEHPPPRADLQMGCDAFKGMATEVPKTDDDPAAPDDQAPDTPARPTAEDNDVSNERDQYIILLSAGVAEVQDRRQLRRDRVEGAGRKGGAAGEPDPLP